MARKRFGLNGHAMEGVDGYAQGIVWSCGIAKRIESYAFRIRLLKVRSHLLPLLPLLIFKLLG